MAKKKRKLSMAERVKNRVEGSSGGERKDHPYFRWPEWEKPKANFEKIVKSFAIMDSKWSEPKVHFCLTEEGNIRALRCLRDRSLSKTERSAKCPACEREKRFRSRSMNKRADREKAQGFFVFNVMWKGAKPFEDEEDGTKYCRLAVFKWQIFEGINDVLDNGNALVGKRRVWLRVLRKRKGVVRKKGLGYQVKYTVEAGDQCMLPKEWKELELHDLDEAYAPMEFDEMAELLGISTKSKKKKKKKSEKDVEKENEDEEEEEEDEDIEEMDED